MDRVEEAARKYVPVQDYLAAEETAEVRHEYIGGQVHAMAGASREHNRIAGHLFFALRQHVGAGPCAAFISDM